MSTEFFNNQWRIPSNENQSLVSNYSMEFNGINTSVSLYVSSIPIVPSRYSDWTYSAWLYLDSTVTGAVPCIFERGAPYPGDGMIVGVKNTDKSIYVYTGGTTATNFTSLTLPTDEWAFFALVYDVSTNELTCYINNSSQTLTAPSGWNISSTLLIIGKRQSNHSSYFWKGEMNQVSIFDYALPATGTNSIATLYGGGTAVTNPMALSPNPIAVYQLGDQSVSTGTSSNYLVTNNSLQDYVFAFAQPPNYSTPTTNTPIIAQNQGSIFSGISNFSFSGWFNIPVYTLFQVFDINVGSNLYFNINMYGNDLRFNVGLYGSSGGYSYIEDLQNIVPVNTWFHLAGVFDGSGASDTDRLKLYIDGEPRTVVYGQTNPTSFPTIPSNADINLGRSTSFLQTTMFSSNIQLWDSSLIPSEVETLYNNGSPLQTLSNVPQNPNLKLWWKLDSSEIYNSSTTEWEINQAQAYVQNSVFCPNVSGQTVTDYLQVSNYSGTTGKTAASWSFWYNTLEANNQGGWLSGGSAEFKRNNSGQQPGMEFTLYTDVGGVNKTWSTYFSMPYGKWFIQAPESQVLNKWINVVLTYDQSAAPEFGTESGSIILYVNGVKQATSSGTSGGVTNPGYSEFPAEGTIRTGNLIFGGGNFATRHVSASLSNYATWDKALTQAEINEIVNGGQPKNLSTHSASSNLISWWRLNNLTTGLVDTIGSYNATIVGSNSVVKPGSISQLNGTSSGMSTSSLVQSDLSFTSGYSPYALDFDGTNQAINLNSAIALTGNRSVNFWFTWKTSGVYLGGSNNNDYYPYILSSTSVYLRSSSSAATSIVIPALQTGKFYNMCITGDGTTVSVYIDGNLAGTGTDIANITLNTIANVTSKVIGADGNMSNVAIWDNTVLSQSEVTEIYNQGAPTNLNNFTPKPTNWWQLGSNSSFNAITSQWTCLDEIGTNIGVSSTNMTNDDIVNGPGYSANGLGTNTIDIIGDAPYSTANGLSENMDVLDRVTDVPS